MFDVPASAESASAESASPNARNPVPPTDSLRHTMALTVSERSATEASGSGLVVTEPSGSGLSAAEASVAKPLVSVRPASGPGESGKKCPEALAAEITTLAGHLNAAQYRFLKLLEEFDREQGWAGPGVRSLAHWLSWKCGIGELVAREKVRVARALRELPMIDASFERGQISYSKVRAMTRAATPENEAQLLNIARHGTAEHMERLVRVYRRCRKRAEASPGETERRREERFYCFDEDDETMVFGGRVSVEQGRLLMKALDAMIAEMEDDERAGGENVSAETSAAGIGASVSAETSAAASEKNVSAETSVDGPEASVSAETPAADSGRNVSAETSAVASGKIVSAETLSGGRPGVEPHEPDTPPLKPLRVRRATALAQIAEHYLATRNRGARARPGATPLRSSDAYQVFVHVNANDANPDNRINGAHTTYTDDRRCIAPHVARQLACDASRRTVLENERGEVLNIGRRSRIVPWHIAHALRIRDGGCRFPGCNQHRWTDAHHIHHWADGGETSLDNLVTLCRYHHRELHRDEYRIERGAGGELIFMDAQHQAIPPAIHPQYGDRHGSSSVAEAGSATDATDATDAAVAAVAADSGSGVDSGSAADTVDTADTGSTADTDGATATVGAAGTDGAAASAAAPSAADRLEQLQAEHLNRGVKIDASTAVTRWAGERMDYSTAIEWLLHKDGIEV